MDLSATDEVHFQRHGSRCQMWIPPETKDPILLHAPARRCVGCFGAVRLRDGSFCFAVKQVSSIAPLFCLHEKAATQQYRHRPPSRGDHR